ncbi:Alpha/Beta hydrolase protein [Aspergillus egyptiacus]|nr:Alpha/Beta hydrolase protein [Aspergillus egyptiacus]
MAATTDRKLQGFDLIQSTYKQVGHHGIRADILVPQGPSSGKRPVILRFHGGGLVMGDSLFLDFWPEWLSDLAREHGAVIVSPNYRLMPHATGLDVYEDVQDVWAWLHSPAVHDLLAAHSTPTELDLTRIMLVGESAGGLLSVNMALAHAGEVRSAVATYPCIDMKSPDFTTPRERLPFGQHTPETVIQDTVAASNGPVSSAATPAHLAFMLAAIEHGRLGGWYVRDSEGSPREGLLHPMERLEKPGVVLPPGGITILHGRQDSLVPVRQAEAFVRRAREVTGSDRVKLTVRDGEHGFDGAVRYDEEWLYDALKTAVESWLQSKVE